MCTSSPVPNANMSDQSQPSTDEPGVPPGPHQPSEFNFPVRTYGKQNRAFQTHWFRSFPWLHYLETNDSVLCHTCITADKQKKLINARNLERAFLVEGFCNWKKALETFRDHQKSTCYRLAVEHAESQRMYGDIGEKMNATLAEERKKNRMIFIKILENVKFLSQQGLALQGNESGNFWQLLKLRAADDPHLCDWMKKKRDKYTSHDIQNEIVRIMATDILRDIADSVSHAKFFSILADECTDASNKEQLTICLRWIDQALEPNEDFVGFCEISNIMANTIDNYTEDINMPNFEAHLLLFEEMPREEYTCFEDVYRAYRKVDSANKLLVSEVEILLKLVCPGNAVGERSFSTARHIKTWLRSSMNQCRFNNLAILTVHKERTDKIYLRSVAKQFT
ncbi:Zinc finger MYM-type protein 1 [Holothuria leucospilota]|uniref:Zinc finger MYM-type protein 1 n=1 Tax=Holothuria leucospilota TaxID=206669 RepID=A0A9Q0YC54_HOLLE|nr:Zinc finger MYM-type protein 1 [Holothuria leucospilota]